MQNPPARKKFKLFDAVLASVCVVVTIEGIAPAAKIGNSQYFWWMFLIAAFFLPYGMISSELGTAYSDEGGIYAWVRKAFGIRWGSRVACYYWLNFPVWVSSITILFTDAAARAFSWQGGSALDIAVQLAIIWAVAYLSFFRVGDSKWILNVAAAFKAILVLVLGSLGIRAALTRGAANAFTFSSFLPRFSAQNDSYIAFILFDLMGFEVIATYAGDMRRPEKQLPRAIKLGGILIAAFYLFAAFGISVAIPVQKLSASTGIVESLEFLLGNSHTWLVGPLTLMFLYSLFSNLLSWSLGVNYVLKYAAQDGSLPRIMGKETKQSGMPAGATVVNAAISSAIVILQAFLPGRDLFWQFFAMNTVILLMSYVMIFPAFLKLRKTDGQRPRPFLVKGGPARLRLTAYIPMGILIVSILLAIVPTGEADWAAKLPLLAGSLAAVLFGEIVARRSAGKALRDGRVGGNRKQ